MVDNLINVRLFFLYIFLIFPVVSHAASFDCEKAVGGIENKICLDREVSDLDSNLAHLYYSLKDKSNSIVEDQKNWLKNTRNKCENIDCLRSVYAARISHLKNAKPCPAIEKDILGYWVRVKNGFFEEMSFSENGGSKGFSSWLHHRPELNGTWKFSNCTIQINDGSGGLNFVFKIIKISDKEMQVFDDDEQKTAIYKRITKK